MAQCKIVFIPSNVAQFALFERNSLERKTLNEQTFISQLNDFIVIRDIKTLFISGN